MDAADILNIKLMKCGGLYPAEQINAIAQANGLTCMVGCMMETKLSITAGLSFVAAKKNVMDADLDSFMEYVGGETHFPGGFTHKGSDFVLCDAPGFGLDIDF
jgi:L-alanine-DL-glutamate epimerase-like enolase superfamily enzyme